MIRMLLILTSVFLRYFKANWDKSEYINKKLNRTVIKKRNIQNVFMVKNIISKKKMHIEKANVDVRDNIRKIVSLQIIPKKHDLVQIIGNSC